ncbi:hypothetical protein HYW74_02770 [Candidatus Pacearchaeota archaeon]|nr:hypothetical protein [Candidatus Pacearchaeota archaeon]
MAKIEKQEEELNDDCEDCCMNELDQIKEKYLELQKKYSLPNFEQLNEEFDIGKSEFNHDTILRDVRKSMVNKFFAILSFTELLLNPSTGSMFYMFLVKGINSKEKEILNGLFDRLGDIEIDSFELDVTYNEKAEAKFISEKYKVWQEIKKELTQVLDSLKKNWGSRGIKKEKTYFG